MKPSTPEVVRPRRKFTVFWDRETVEAAQYLVAKCAYAECQWFHFVDRTITATGDVQYYISGIIIPEQIVTSATVESDSKAMLKIAMELREKHGLSVRNDKNELVAPIDANGQRIPPSDEAVEDFNRDCQRLAVWCHSHVKMACHPSGTDNEQWRDWIGQKITEENPSQPVMMFIFNQLGEYFSRLYDPVLGAEVENATFHIVDTFSLSYIDDLLKTRIKQKVYNTSTGSSTNYGGNKGGGGSTGTNLTSAQPTTPTQTGGKITAATDGKFKIAWTGATYEKTLSLANKIVESPNPFSTEIEEIINDFVIVNDQWFGDDSDYCWYIIDLLLFDEDRIDLKALYSPTKELLESYAVKNSVPRFKTHCQHQDTFGAALFPAAIEIAFGYTLQEQFSLGPMISALTQEWLGLEEKLGNQYRLSKNSATKNKKRNNVNGNASSR